MPQKAWSAKRERQYEHIEENLEERGTPKKKAKEIAARTVNKTRAQTGEAKESSKLSAMTRLRVAVAGFARARIATRAAPRRSSTTRPSGWASTAAPR